MGTHLYVYAQYTALLRVVERNAALAKTERPSGQYELER
jgi:hypothetical protein